MWESANGSPIRALDRCREGGQHSGELTFAKPSANARGAGTFAGTVTGSTGAEVIALGTVIGIIGAAGGWRDTMRRIKITEGQYALGGLTTRVLPKRLDYIDKEDCAFQRERINASKPE